MELFETFSDYLKQTIQASPEWRSKGAKTAPNETGFDDFEDAPF
jgi:hypothetical protein